MKRRCLVRTFWLIGVVHRGNWSPCLDLPPIADGDAEKVAKVAKQFARDRTRMSGRPHQAKEFSTGPGLPADGRTAGQAGA